MAAALLGPLVAALVLRRRRGVCLAACAYTVFVVHASFDWDWELPAVTVAGLWCGVALLAEPGSFRTVSVGGRRRAAAEIFARQLPGGFWERNDRFYVPKYFSTNWMLLILSDLGLTKKDKRVAAACEEWIQKFSKPDGGFAMEGSKTAHLCTTGQYG